MAPTPTDSTAAATVSPGDGGDGGPWTDATKKKFETKSKSQYFDPCQEAAARSIKCLNRNNGDRDMCGEYFQAYRDCKQAWIDKRKEDRRKAGGGLW